MTQRGKGGNPDMGVPAHQGKTHQVTVHGGETASKQVKEGEEGGALKKDPVRVTELQSVPSTVVSS